MFSREEYDAIMRKYQNKQFKALQEQEERTSYVFSVIPEYKDIDDSIASCSVALTKRILLGDKNAKAEISTTIDELTKKKKQLLVNAGLPEDYLDIHYECPMCKDTGFISSGQCSCLRKILSDKLSEESGLSTIIKDNNFEILSYEYYKDSDLLHFKNAVASCHKFVDNFAIDYDNLLFYGNVGTGKSFLSCCIAKELLDRGYSVIYFSSPELFRVMSDMLFGRGDYNLSNAIHSQLFDSDLLIIDDLGTELTNNAVATELFSLLNERFRRRKSTIISTNLDLQQLQERYADRIFSRLLERYSFHKITGPDIRKEKRINNH